MWGQLQKGEDPYAPQGKGGLCAGCVVVWNQCPSFHIFHLLLYPTHTHTLVIFPLLLIATIYLLSPATHGRFLALPLVLCFDYTGLLLLYFYYSFLRFHQCQATLIDILLESFLISSSEGLIRLQIVWSADRLVTHISSTCVLRILFSMSNLPHNYARFISLSFTCNWHQRHLSTKCHTASVVISLMSFPCSAYMSSEGSIDLEKTRHPLNSECLRVTARHAFNLVNKKQLYLS